MIVGSVCYATEQGLGRLGKSFFDAGVIQRVLIHRHPHGDRSMRTDWYPPATPIVAGRRFIGREVDEFLAAINVLLCFETPFDWSLLHRCKGRGIKTVLIPMYEWHLENPPSQFDYYMNPSLLDQDYFPHGEFIPVPVVGIPWRLRTVAKNYLHNAGWIGSRNHKGTLELLKAMRHVKSDLHLTVRCQDRAGLGRLIEASKCLPDDRITYDTEATYEGLFTGDHDVYVAPEKYNGLSLPLQEAHAAGMLVLASDRFPANTWLPRHPLIPVESTRLARTQAGHLEFDESIILPEAIAVSMDFWYGRDISAYSNAGLYYAQRNSWEVLKPRYLAALEKLL